MMDDGGRLRRPAESNDPDTDAEKGDTWPTSSS
jgi:hypothetical protein